MLPSPFPGRNLFPLFWLKKRKVWTAFFSFLGSFFLLVEREKGGEYQSQNPFYIWKGMHFSLRPRKGREYTFLCCPFSRELPIFQLGPSSEPPFFFPRFLAPSFFLIGPRRREQPLPLSPRSSPPPERGRNNFFPSPPLSLRP